MLKHSETIINSSVRRQNPNWDYQWNTQGDSLTWYFNGDTNEPRRYDEYTWDQEHPVFEYQAVDPEPDISTDKTEDDPEGQTGKGPNGVTEDWNTNHPYNPTRYLRPGDDNSFIRLTSTVQNVTIDPIPPAFVSDYGTEYLALECDYEDSVLKSDGNYYTKALRDIVIEFKDEVGLDFRQIALVKTKKDGVDYVPDWGHFSAYDADFIPTDTNIIYYFDRTLPQPVKQLYVDNVKFNATKAGQYKVKFSLNEKWATKNGSDYNEKGNILEELNNGDEANISLIVWDLAGNYSIYKFKKVFKTLAIDDLNKLERVIISFIDIEPDEYFLEDGVEGRITTTVQDPNVILWEYENVFGLTKQSIGVIDENTIDNNIDHNPPDGLSTFIITHLTESGIVEVEAWVQTGFDEIDEYIKERTYNTAICGPWIYGDEGRKYHITPYVPKYLHGTDFADFIEYFQLYINTMYKGLENNRHISGLEKIARIGNFNDISRLENSLVYHYANEFGNEFDFDVEKLQNLNFVQNGVGYTTRDIKETFDIIKYVLEQLPAYNRYKGTNTGIEMAIKMFGFTCRVINMWVKMSEEIEVNPEFLEEDSLNSTEGYFMTSRFNLKFDTVNNSFKTFCDNIVLFIDLIKSVKPITKILNAIKYTIKVSKDINLVYKLEEVSDDRVVKYNLTWTLNKDHLEDVYTIKHICEINPETGSVDLFGLNYTPECTATKGNESFPAPTEIFNEIGKFLLNTTNGVKFKVIINDDEIRARVYSFILFDVILNSGSFYLYLKKGDRTFAKDLINYMKLDKIIDGSEPNRKITITTSFTLIPGTEYSKCEI